MASIEGRYVLVSGASQGIGKAIALKLAASGHSVHGVSRSRPEFSPPNQFPAAERINWSSLDLSDAAAVEHFAAGLEGVAFGGLVLSAVDYGEGGRHHASETSASEWQRVVATNLIGQSILVSRLLPKLASAAPGVVINLSSDVAVAPSAGRSAYAASKAGLHAMLRAVAAEYSTQELRVYQLIPTFQTVTTGIRRRRPADFDFSSYADPEVLAGVVDRIMDDSGISIPGGSYIVRRDGTLEAFKEAGGDLR